jgi:hypothetical protein
MRGRGHLPCPVIQVSPFYGIQQSVSFRSPEEETVSETFLFSSYLEFRTMDKFRKSSDSQEDRCSKMLGGLSTQKEIGCVYLKPPVCNVVL